jgi:lipid II:glycine glycyltransferase (peptidoglycan interpeptide bridge formation enzyme)
MEFKVRNIGDAAAWDAFVTGFGNYSVTHSFAWGELKRSFGWDVRRFWLEEGNVPFAGGQVLLRRIPLSTTALGYAPRGLLADYGDAEAVTAVSKAARSICEEENAVILKTEPMAAYGSDMSAYEKAGNDPIIKGVQPKQTLSIDLSQSEDDLLAGMNGRTRYNVRLSEKKGVRIGDGNGEEELGRFYDLLEATSKRKHFLVHNRAYYDRMLELFRDNLRIFLAEYDNMTLSGVFLLTFGKYAYYSYGASRRKHSNTKSTQGLQWAAIRWAKENGFKVYDFWGIPDNPGKDHPLYGVYKFKLGFGGEIEKYVGAYDMDIKPLRASLLRAGMKVQGALRNLLARGTMGDPMGN